MSTDSVRSTDGGSLGINTDFAVTEFQEQSFVSDDEKRRAAVSLRYDLQDTAKYLLKNEPEGKRLLACMIVRVQDIPKGFPDDTPMDMVLVERDSQKEKARYSNLVHCDSPWLCPICSQRQTEADKGEVNRAYLSSRSKGWIAVMVTYTQRHTKASPLRSLLEINSAARRWMKSNSRLDGDTWGDIKARYGLVGGIINLECTHGDNAWHPHNHELLFIDPARAESDDLDELRWTLAKRWQSAVRKQGGDCDLYHGLHLRTGDDAISEYIAKFGHEPEGGWSMEAEMTKGSSKIGKRDGRTPFQLLYDCKFAGDRQAGALFVEFAKEFFGKAHLRWSQGLRDALDMENFVPPVTPQEESKQEAEKPVFEPFLALPEIAWRNVVLRQYGRRAAFLIACEKGAVEVSDLLARWGYTGQVYWLSPVTANSAPPAVTAKSAPQQKAFEWDIEPPKRSFDF